MISQRTLRLLALLNLISIEAIAYPLANDLTSADPLTSESSPSLFEEDQAPVSLQAEEGNSFESASDVQESVPAGAPPQAPEDRLDRLQNQIQELASQTRTIQESLNKIQGQLQTLTPAPSKFASETAPKALGPSSTLQGSPFKRDASSLPLSPLRPNDNKKLQTNADSESSLSPTASLPEGPAQEQYAYALSLLRNRDLVGARQTFKAFVAMHPEDALVINAKYWLGDIAFQQEDYETAAVTFGEAYQEILKHKKNSQSPQRNSKAPEILAKLACSLTHLGRSADACVTLQQLEKEFPRLAANAKAMAFRGTALPKCLSKHR